MKQLPPDTPEQSLITQYKGPRLVVKAYAGTGKTTTLVKYAHNNLDSRILYLAYNRAIISSMGKYVRETMKKSPLNLLLLAALTLGASHQAWAQDGTRPGFYERKEEGWFWYKEEPKEPEKKPEKPKPKPVAEAKPTQPKPAAPLPSGPEMFSAEWFRENLPKYKDLAWNNPTVENVRTFLYLQRFAIDRSEQFSDATELAVVGDPFLDEITRRPAATFASQQVDRDAGNAKNMLLKSVAERVGIFFFYKSDDDYSDLQAPLIKMLEQGEGFSIIAFIIVMGSFGLQLAGKYVQTILWIQLWMPVLSIINLFVHTAASNEMSSLSAGGLNSMYALSSTGDVLQHWIATGGMLAAATPVISLFIVTGSTYAFTSLASRISGSDHVDEKMQTPDLLKQGPVMQSQPAYNHNQFSGAIANGAESMISTFSLGSTLASGVSSAQALQSQKSEAFQSTLGRGFSDGVSQDQAYSRLSNVGRNVSSQNTAQSQLINQQAKNFMDKFQVDDSHSDAVKGAFAMQAMGTLDVDEAASMLMPMVGKARAAMKAAAGVKSNSTALVPAGGNGESGGGSDVLDIKAQAKGATESSTQDSSSWSASDVSQFMKGVSYSQTDSQALTNQLAQGFSRSGSESFKQTWGDSLSQNLSKSASELVSASDTFTTMSQLQNQMGSMTNTDFKTLGGAVAQTPAAMNQLNDYFRNAAPQSVKDEAASLQQRYQAYGMSPQVAQAAARMTAMTNSKNYEQGKELGGYQAALQAINTASGRNGAFSGDAYGNNGIEGPNVQGLPGQVQGAVGSGPNIPTGFRENVAGMAGTNPASEAGQLPTNSPLVQNEHAAGTSALHNQAQQTERNVSAPELKKAQDNLMNSLPEMSWSASAWGAWDNSSDWMGRRAEQAGGALIAGGQAGADAFSRAMDQMRTMTPEQRDQFIAATQRGDQAVQEEFGWAGDAMVGMAKLGRNVMGAAASGYDAAKEWLTGKSDLSEAAKGMSIEERGAFYAAALSSAAEAGGGAAQQFMNQYGDEFKETMQSIAQSRYGLTESQAAVYAESFDTNEGRMNQAVQNLKMEYAERNPDGSPMMQGGQPVLSQQNEEFTDKLVNVLQNSTEAGDRSGSYLTAVRGYNIANQRF
ncbi:TPA: conjugal transfer protein TraF [Salmonella enterica subsp. enterica serovar Minnesota]|nr:conjugal transfer protein TraF [Salmonella enterica]MDX9458879.1 conjugal transfer protein TraF [Salmonella enterica]MDX9477269.1 conjugal transfer protein TraF [Salmonella enterica]MDX9481755.1 conjugal transfer protein TraF [Salmonella enterica]MDX9486537.1 conjugal transfer protein TraF [Salmonella enterica]MEA1646514.1 conjugal transfer protein TraF [Salmonella enterica subsp. enterica serovar Minnesota]